MDVSTLPPCKLLQVEVDLRLEGPEPDRAGLDPAADIGQEVAGVVEGDGDALTFEIGPQPTPIPRS